MAGTVLVAGATGYLGRHLVTELALRGVPVRALVRSRARAERPGRCDAPSLSGKVAEWAEGDVTDPAFIAGVCDGADRVVSALGVTRQKASPWDIDHRANLDLLEAAERAGARSFLYVNVMHARSGRSVVMRSKAAFAQVLARSDLAHQIINPSGYFSDLGSFLDMARTGVAFIPPDRGIRIAPVHGADLAAYCIDRMTGPSGSWDVGGPDVLTYRAVARLAFEALHRRPRIVEVPMPVIRAAVWVASRVGERPRDLAQFFAEGLTHDAVGERCGSRHLGDHFRRLALARRVRPASRR